MSQRAYSAADQLVMGFDRALSALFSGAGRAARENPADGLPEYPMRDAEKRHVAGLMRVNHAGEVAAQALYSGQALVAGSPGVRASLLRAADEESDHLYWCETRLRELNSHISHLTPVWYLGSFGIGVLAGLWGDQWNLGFVLETERQVVRHLDRHLRRLPEQDRRSRRILEQMRRDELRHATNAGSAGAAELPGAVKAAMRCCSKVMTGTAYWL